MEKAKRKKVCLLTDHHISLNPRLWKEAFFYEQLGFEVVILSMWQWKDTFQKDMDLLKGHNITYKAYLSLLPEETGKVFQFFLKARKKVAGEFQKRFNISTPWAISYAPGLMFKKAVDENADLYASHLECAFYAGRKLIKAGRKVSFDFEDWYSRDYLIPSRPVKLLRILEKFALGNGLFCTAASQSMAVALIDYYKANNNLTVIYNGFPIIDARVKGKEISHNDHIIKLIWFSRTIGPGRGIEFLLKELSLCQQPVELNLLGKMRAGFKQVLEENFVKLKKHGLVIHDFIPHRHLSQFIAKFDIGLAIEENINDNKFLTVSNKMLQYIQAGIPVIASNTKGQMEVAEYFPQTVSLIDLAKRGVLDNAIEQLKKSNRGQLDEACHFKNIFSWEAQENKFLKVLKEHNLL